MTRKHGVHGGCTEQGWIFARSHDDPESRPIVFGLNDETAGEHYRFPVVLTKTS